MSKVANLSDRNDRESSLAISERPCVVMGCKGTMGIMVKAIGWKSVWVCKECGHTISKRKKDYPLSEALRLRALKAKIEECKKALKKVPEGDEAAALAADTELGIWKQELQIQEFMIPAPRGYNRRIV